MKATLTAQNAEYVGLDVVDNEGVTHDLTLEKASGEIEYHEQDGYPDEADKRTREGNERVNQARRFARFYVFAEKGYDTVPASENPVRIDAVRTAIDAMDVDTFEELFGDLYEQLHYERGGGATPAIDVPPEATDPCIYCQDVYLGIDPLETDVGRTLADAHGISPTDDATAVTPESLSGNELDDWASFTGEFTGRVLGDDVDLSDAVYVEETSDLYVTYPDGADLREIDDHLDRPDREPDAVLEFLPMDPEEPAFFKAFLDHYLRCQIRDCFVEMGLHPPEQYRVLGMGRFMSTWRYDNVDFYPRFHDAHDDGFDHLELP